MSHVYLLMMTGLVTLVWNDRVMSGIIDGWLGTDIVDTGASGSLTGFPISTPMRYVTGKECESSGHTVSKNKTPCFFKITADT